MIDIEEYEGHTPAPWAEGEYIPSDEMIERFQNRELQGAVMQRDSNIMLAMIGLDDAGAKDRKLMADAPLLLEAYKQLRDELDTIKSHRSFEHRFSPTGYGMAIEAWIGLTENGYGRWNDNEISTFDDLRLLTEEEWWQWQEEDIDWPWYHDVMLDAIDYAHLTYLRTCVDMLEAEGGIMALKKKLQESEEE